MAKHKSFIGIKNESADSTLELHFTDFIYDGFDWDTFENINLVQDTIDKIKAANPSKIKVVINSLGGDVMVGLALYNYLKAHSAEVTVEVIGFAASIASIMAMSASPGKLNMAKSGFMIIHPAWSFAAGNASELREQANNLDKISNELASIYALRSGKKASHFTDLWANGDVWLTGTEALEMGLADVLTNTEVKAHANLKDFDFKNIPAQLLNGTATTEPDHKTFFQTLKSDLMDLVTKLKNSVTVAKEDKTTDTIPQKSEILALVESVLTPFAAAIDEKLKVEEKKEETVVEKKDVEPSAEAKRIEALEKELTDVKASISNVKLKPENEKTDKATAMAAGMKIEYAEAN